MARLNKITELRVASNLSSDIIQEHLDLMNADGWELICLDNLVGWYRFFWVKTE